MEYRQLGGSGLRIPVLTFGTGTFGGGNDFFKTWGSTQTAEATGMIDLCLDGGVNLFDCADTYSDGMAEEILGKAVKGRRDKVLISTKGTFPMGAGYNDMGSSRYHIVRACEGSLRRLATDYIDIYHMHGFDGNTPIEETLRTLDDLVSSGKVRYIACSNFSGWHLMKSLAISDRYGWNRYVAHQVYYSLVGREYEWELMPLGLDQKVGALVWSPLAAGLLTGKFNRRQPLPKDSRVAQGGSPVPATVTPDDLLHNVIDVLEEISRETGRTIAQVALNWLLQRPTVSSLVVGARTEKQLRENLGASGWSDSGTRCPNLPLINLFYLIAWHPAFQNPGDYSYIQIPLTLLQLCCWRRQGASHSNRKLHIIRPMKNFSYVRWNRNQVSFSCLVVFVLLLFNFESGGQDQAPRLYARLTMLKVPDGKQQEFETFAKENIKPLQNLRRQEGKIVLWILFKVKFAGQGDDYNYVGVSYSPTWEGTEPESFVTLLKQLKPDADVVAFQVKQRELRTLVREHIFYQLEAIEPNPPVPSRYVRLDYMKTRPGKNADYLKAEREDWMPFHRTLMMDGQSSGWGLWQVVFPGGTGLPYDFVTSNRYSTYAQVQATDYEKTFRKASPNKNINDIFNRTTQSRDIVKSELWEVVDILN